jgi:hypothetical protein
MGLDELEITWCSSAVGQVNVETLTLAVLSRVLFELLSSQEPRFLHR